MARKGDGIYKRGKVWYLDSWISGKRCMANLGKNITRAVALELASIERARFLRAEAGIKPKKRKDMAFETAKEQFLATAETHKSNANGESCSHWILGSGFQSTSFTIAYHGRGRIAERS